MSIGTGGRMVVELDPSLKRDLYSQLALDGLTFKGWLVREVSRYLATAGPGSRVDPTTQSPQSPHARFAK